MTQVHLVLQDSRVQLAPWEFQDNRVLLVLKAHRDLLVDKELGEMLAHKDLKAFPDLRVLLEVLALRVSLDDRELLDHLEQLASQV